MFQWKDAVWLFVGLMLVGLVGVGLWFAIQGLFQTLSVLDKSVVEALITGTLVACGAIFVKHIEHRHSVEAQFRDDKVKMYNELLDWFVRNTEGEVDRSLEITEFLKDWKRKILFWCGPQIIRNFLSLSRLGEIKTVGDLAASTKGFWSLLLGYEEGYWSIQQKNCGQSKRS